jgi:hypothetical protein
MGAYQYLHDHDGDDSVGILRTADNAIVPPEASNADWQEYQAWLAEPNTPDAATSTSLSEYKLQKKAQLDDEFEEQLRAHLWFAPGAGAASAFAVLKTIQEAIEVETDGSPTSSRYPMLNAMVGMGGSRGGSISAVGTSVRADWDGMKTSVADIHDVRDTAYRDIDAAADKTAVDAVTWTWP